MTMPSSSSRRWSAHLLVSLFVMALHHLPNVRAKFNETDCLRCVGDEIDEAFNFTKTYCEVGEIGSGTYQCVDIDSDLCSDNEHHIHTSDWECDPDWEGVIDAAEDLAIGLIVFFWCCGSVVVAAIIGGIIACVCCCGRKSNRPPQQPYPGAPPPMVLPGTLTTASDKTTTTTADEAVLPAQTGLDDNMESPYYQPSYDNSNNNYKA
jgi:hypothetical protein